MPFIPHTEADIKAMLSTIGVDSIEQLFDEIPQDLRIKELGNVPHGMSEMEIQQLMKRRAAKDGNPLNFIGAGAYEHYIPAAVWELTTRGEFYSAYTPYQAEASQGTLQLLYEYQSMMASLMDMDVSNASLYDGATALAEAVLMAIRCNRKSKSRSVLMPRSVSPFYRDVVKTIVSNQDIKLIEVDFHQDSGTLVDIENINEEVAAVIIPQINFFGCVEDVDQLTNWASQHNAISIALVNPLSLSILKPPGQWGEQGADLACGDGQVLGIPLSSGGPYFGFLCCKQQWVRQLPGRLIGKTTDMEGKPGYALTLQAREQHIRRSKATSNICTNQGLLVTAATLYMAIMGFEGMRQSYNSACTRAHELVDELSTISGVAACFNGPFLHETCLKLDRPVSPVLQELQTENIIGGLDLSLYYPEMENVLLVCATETKSEEDIQIFGHHLHSILGET